MEYVVDKTEEKKKKTTGLVDAMLLLLKEMVAVSLSLPTLKVNLVQLNIVQESITWVIISIYNIKYNNSSEMSQMSRTQVVSPTTSCCGLSLDFRATKMGLGGRTNLSTF